MATGALLELGLELEFEEESEIWEAAGVLAVSRGWDSVLDLAVPGLETATPTDLGDLLDFWPALLASDFIILSRDLA